MIPISTVLDEVSDELKIRSIVQQSIAEHERKQARFGVLLLIAIAVAVGAIGFIVGRLL